MTEKKKYSQFEKATFQTKRYDFYIGQYGLKEVQGVKLGATGLGYYKEENQGFYIVHIPSGYSMGMPLQTQKQAKEILLETDSIGFDWSSSDDRAIANAVLPDGSKLYEKFREIYNKYA